ncbi:MAG TPA: alcohol dehydrogenase catalytic domain-containing protein [Acidimicrobiales bacterium]
MPAQVRAAVLEGVRDINVRSFPMPSIGNDDAIIRVEACGLCGTDHEQWSGHLRAPYPYVPGHETVGVIEAIGPVAAQRWGVDVGDRVAVEIFQSCRECDACRAEVFRDCERHGLTDPIGQIPTSSPPAIWGGYAEYQYLGPDVLVQRVPRDLDAEVAAMFNAVAAGFRWGVRVPGTKPGDRVAVLGPGVRGIAAAAAAKRAGAAFVMVTGLGPRDAPRLEAAKKFGADLVVDVAVEDPVDAFTAACGGLANVVVDVTANAPAALPQAIALAAERGTVVMAGTRGDVDIPGFRADPIVVKQLRLQGTVGVDRVDYRSAIELLASRAYPFEELPRARAGLEDLGRLLARMAGETDEDPPMFGVVVP